MIEHAWAAITSHLVGVVLPNTLPPDTTAHLSKVEKDAAIFDNSIEVCNSYFKDKHWDGFPICAHKVPCMDPDVVYTDSKVQDRIVKAPRYEYQANAQLGEIKEEFAFFAKHSVRRHNQMEFVVCENPTCGHCTSVPIKAPKLLATIRRNGGIMPTPTKCTDHPDHFMTLLEYLDYQRKTGSVTGVDQGLPAKKTLDMCERGCKHVLFSLAGKKRHNWLCHQ
jgi:hypothetical protein